ncbi:MAG: two-component regulator propeller domain-containing protein, partial [Terriglobales bacterium]
MPDSTSVEALMEGDNGELLIGTGNGIKRLVGDKVEAYPLPGIEQLKPNSMLRDRDGGLWIGTEDRGLLHLHRGRADVFTQSDGLSGNYVTNLFEDREHNVWVSTLTGLDKFRDFTVHTISVNQGLSNDTVLSVLAAKDGRMWFGTRDGLNRWKDGQITIYRKRAPEARPGGGKQEEHLNVREITGSRLPDSGVGSLGEDAQGRIWVSTNAGIGYFENDRFIPIRDAPGGRVSGIAADGAGNVWISNQKHGLLHLVGNHLVEQIPWDKLGHKDFALSVLADPVHGGLWLGLFRGGLVYWKNGQAVSSYSPEALGGGQIADLQSDPDGTLWASSGSGLIRVNSGRVSTLTSKNGLPCDNVHGMREDSNHSAWLYMGCGLVRIARSELDAWVADPKRTVQVTVFDGTDGVTSHEIETPFSPRIAKSADGKIWFLPFDGVSFVDPQHISFNKLPPPVHVEQVTAGRKTYDASNGLRLPPHVRDLVIDYTALSFVAPEKVRFRYKLEGLDADWQEAGNRRQAFYTNLPPRNYRFRVIACNNSGVWNEQGASLDFAITPAFYQTNWFRALCAAVFLALLWTAYRLRVRQLRRQEKKLRDVIETIPTFAWTALPDGSIDFVNGNWQRYTGMSNEESAGSGWAAAVHPADLKRDSDKWRTSVKTGAPFENEVRFRRADGEYRWFLVRAVPLRDAHGNVRKWYGTSTDIEDRKHVEQLQTELAHINRVTTMGELTASLAHELKQPITASVTNANACMRWLNREQPDVERASEAAKRIVGDGKRAGDIIERLRSLYKKSPPKRELVDVNDIVREMVVLLRGEANRYAVSIRMDLAADVPKILADRVQLQQVLMNLMLNSIEAMRETGGVVTSKSQLDQDNQVMISVSDTGVGLPADKADEIFNAFFTTKPHGSGMGLAISRSIVESHGGRLRAKANEGRGATFH